MTAVLTFFGATWRYWAGLAAVVTLAWLAHHYIGGAYYRDGFADGSRSGNDRATLAEAAQKKAELDVSELLAGLDRQNRAMKQLAANAKQAEARVSQAQTRIDKLTEDMATQAKTVEQLRFTGTRAELCDALEAELALPVEVKK
jgi:hypothetical protein